jgi:hypothetical protein
VLDRSLFIFIAIKYSLICIFQNYLFNSTINGHLSFRLGTIFNNADMNILVHISCKKDMPVLNSWVYI